MTKKEKTMEELLEKINISKLKEVGANPQDIAKVEALHDLLKQGKTWEDEEVQQLFGVLPDSFPFCTAYIHNEILVRIGKAKPIKIVPRPGIKDSHPRNSTYRRKSASKDMRSSVPDATRYSSVRSRSTRTSATRAQAERPKKQNLRRHLKRLSQQWLSLLSASPPNQINPRCGAVVRLNPNLKNRRRLRKSPIVVAVHRRTKARRSLPSALPKPERQPGNAASNQPFNTIAKENP